MSNSIMDITNVKTSDLLPSALAEDPSIQAILTAIDEQWKEIAQAIPCLGVLASIDLQPDDVLNKLAWQFHVDYWDDTWSLAKKRRVVKNSIYLHRIAGTRGAVEDVIDTIWGEEAVLSEWWEHGGEPGTFQVALESGITEENISRFISMIRKVKRATDRLTITAINECDPGQIYYGAAYHQYQSYRLEA